MYNPLNHYEFTIRVRPICIYFECSVGHYKTGSIFLLFAIATIMLNYRIVFINEVYHTSLKGD